LSGSRAQECAQRNPIFIAVTHPITHALLT
jgi:hypothetical protein